MAFFRLVLYTSKLNRINQKVIAEKNAAAAISRKEKPKYGWRLKLSHLWIECKRRLNNCLINSNFLKKTFVERFFYRLRRYGSFENYVLKSLLGFFGGYLLTYLLFVFLSVQLNVRLTVATLICCFLGCILTIGLAFSQNIRCIVFLTLPQFFSKRGRQALIAYALILTITGPAKNTLNNMGIMSESLACGQEQLKSAVRQILDVIKKPFVAIKEALKSVVKAVKEVIKKIKEILIKIKRVIMAIIGVIKSVFQFLGRILNLCNKELGTPYQRCERVFEGAITDCQASLGPFFSWTCSIGYLLESVCYIVKPFDLICLLVDFLSDSIIGVVMRKLKIFIRHVKTMFYVRIKFSHSYHFESKSSKSMREIASSIVGEVKTRTKGIASVFEFFNCAASLFFIFLISRVVNYRHQFLTKERFDNKFLTKNLVDIDLRRAEMERETIFPLNHRERKKYITIQSIRLLSKEQKQLAEGLGLLMSTALKIGTHMAIDYSLFWIMNLIRKYGKFQSKVQAPNIPTVHIAGEGFLADLLKAVVKSFQPLGISLEIDTVPCLPIPIPPDFDRYVQIASILALCLLLTIFEPYGLRWRNWILCYYYPRRAKERAVWLYNHILRSRASFLKFARRQLRRKVLGSEKITKVTCLEYLRSKTNNKCLLLFLGSDKQQACLLCGEVFRKSDKETAIKCQRPGCTAMYCKQCFEDLENVCTVCLSPIDYGDMSDFSEERDSSDEDQAIPSKSTVDTGGFDSGMTTDEPTEETEGSTDEYSYSYQETEKAPSIISDYRTEYSRDIEKQSSPDYVSMQYFDEEIELYSLKTAGLDDRDEGTQFPDASSSSIKVEKETDIKDELETSSAASSFQQQIEDQHLEDESCSCLTLDTVEETPSKLLIDELKRKLSSMGSERKYVEHPSLCMVQDLKPIPEQTEDEALIQFSPDEEKEERNTVYESSHGSFISRSHSVKPEARKSSSSNDIPKDTESSSDGKRFLSDSEFSENDVKQLIGKSRRNKKSHIPESSTNSSDEHRAIRARGLATNAKGQGQCKNPV
ncbi:DC-STAMP domain-containing protein 2-like [Coccinella septempunctata]|uniref:DC-STAMP domain-containing protein 2-like n=1 Tax=Coccinella septempunctata TaxID=41139 RepID=UPI001D07211D|nr:DC-STAMP domain-containing protein 2-like [Coccinella septempunctata]